MWKRFVVVGLVVALAAGAFPAIAPERALAGPGSGNNPGLMRVEGTITAINLNVGTVTITTRAGLAVTVVAVAATKIERNGIRTTLAGLRLGDRGQARFDGATAIATKIESVGP